VASRKGSWLGPRLVDSSRHRIHIRVRSHLPVLATIPTTSPNRASDHSDTGPSPTAHTKPMSSRNTAPKPIGRRDKEPNPPIPMGPKPIRSPALGPMPVGVKVLRSSVVRAGAVNAFGIADQVIAVIVPLVPIVAIAAIFNFKLRVGAAATNDDHLALAHLLATRRCGKLPPRLCEPSLPFHRGKSPQCGNLRPLWRTNGQVRGVYFGTDLAGLKSGIRGRALAHLDLNFFFRKAGNIRLRASVEAQNVREIELHFSPSVVASGNPVAGHDGSIESSRSGISRVAALRRNVAMNQADACDAMAAVDLPIKLAAPKSVIAAIANFVNVLFMSPPR